MTENVKKLSHFIYANEMSKSQQNGERKIYDACINNWK